MEKKKSWLRPALIIGGILIIVGGYLFTTLIAPTAFKVENKEFSHYDVPQSFNNFKIGFVSDVHLKSEEEISYFESCITKLNEASCDMVVFGGDLFDNGISFEKETVKELLQSIQAPYGKLAILGEDEFKSNLDDSISLLEDGGFEVLRNTSRPIYYQDASINLIALENNSDITNLYKEGRFNLVVVHQPDYFKNLIGTNVQLTLAGHSGGGFIYLPFIGSLHKLEGGQEYNHGVVSPGEETLMICNGIGLPEGVTTRFNALPNALVVTLKHNEASPKPQKETPEDTEPSDADTDTQE